MSGTFISKENERIDVPPTLVSFAVNTADRDRIISAEFKKPGNQAYCIHLMKDSNGLPLWDAVRAQLEDIYEGISDGRIISANFVER